MAWNPKKSNYTGKDGKISWCSACLYKQDGCKLPVKNPDGSYNHQGLISAWKMAAHVSNISSGELRKIKIRIANLLIEKFNDNKYKTLIDEVVVKDDVDYPIMYTTSNDTSNINGTIITDTRDRNYPDKNYKIRYTKNSLKMMAENWQPTPLGYGHDYHTKKYLTNFNLNDTGTILKVSYNETSDGHAYLRVEDSIIKSEKIKEMLNNRSLSSVSLYAKGEPVKKLNDNGIELVDITNVIAVDFVDYGRCQVCTVQYNDELDEINIHNNNVKLNNIKNNKLRSSNMRDERDEISIIDAFEATEAFIKDMPQYVVDTVIAKNKNKIIKDAREDIIAEARKDIIDDAREDIIGEAKPKIIADAKDEIIEEYKNSLTLEDEFIKTIIEEYKETVTVEDEFIKKFLIKDNINDELIKEIVDEHASAINAEKEVETFVDGLVKEGKILPAKKDENLKLAKKDFESYKILADQFNPQTNLQGVLGDYSEVGNELEDEETSLFMKE